MEDIMNPAQANEETVTSESGQDSSNNQPNVSENVNTQANDRTANERIRQLVRERDEWKQKATLPSSSPVENSSAKQNLPDDKVWKNKMEILTSHPELKEVAQDIAEYQTQFGIPLEDAIKVKASDYISKMNGANNSRTGGTANPAARVENQEDLSKMTKDEIASKLDAEIRNGLRV